MRDWIDELVDYQLSRYDQVRKDNDSGVARGVFEVIDDLAIPNRYHAQQMSYVSYDAATWSAKEGLYVENGATYEPEHFI